MSFDHDTPEEALAKTKILVAIAAFLYSPVFLSLVIAWFQGQTGDVPRTILLLLLLPEVLALVYIFCPRHRITTL